ncbi:MAG: cyclic pyranopterin monophosphate synthase MoaC [Gemmatimonadota bacterium]|jgi:cyclic pyranopterin phosphate synthase|nr:cyclic pyranopterin monophosphate synthase MoaC [Gemmatimonadota bacterium]HIC55109.1 cyclic pyranopterin monophosphate synthase MoaC [Gemmatimonadota bacterium]
MTDSAEGLTHLDDEGRARMVDVSQKAVTDRRATATGHIVMDAATLARIVAGDVPKGSVVQVAELAGVLAGKKTSDLIPLCHQLPGANITVRLDPDEKLPGIVAHAEAIIAGQTGVEMEALTAVSVALLTVYDMVKAVDRGMRIGGIALLSKEGGASGSWLRDSGESGE